MASSGHGHGAEVAPVAESALGGLVAGLLGVVKSTDVTIQSASKLTTGLDETARAVKNLHSVLDLFTSLLKVPFTQALTNVKAQMGAVVAGALDMAGSFGKVAASIGGGPAAILAAGLAISAATGSMLPGFASIGLSIEALGKNLGHGFAGQVVFATGATVTATAAVLAAGVMWKNAIAQGLAPAVFLATAAVAGLAAVFPALDAALAAVKLSAVALGFVFGGFGPLLAVVGVAATTAGLAIGKVLIVVGTAAAGLAVALGGLGTIIVGPLSLGIAAVSAAFGGLADLILPRLTQTFSAIATALEPVTSRIGAAFSRVREALAPAAEAVGQWAKDTFGKVGTAAAATVGAIGVVVRAGLAIDHVMNSVYKAIEGTVGAVAGLLGQMAQKGASILRGPMQSLDTAVSAVSANVGRFVQMANPASFNRFHMAVNDMYATIGHALVPVMDQATAIFRSIGDTLAGLDGSGTRLIQAAMGGTAALIAFAGAMVVVETVATGGLAPLIELLAGGLLAGIAGAVTATGGLTKYMDGFTAVLGGTMNALGTVITAMEPVGDAVMGVFGDIAKLFAGYIQQVAGAVAPAAEIFGAVVEVFREIYEAVRPVIEGMLQVQFGIIRSTLELLKIKFMEAAPYLVVFVRGIGAVVSALAEGTKQLLALVGIDLGDFNPKTSGKKSSVGAAATQASTSGIEEVLTRARQAAYGAGIGGPASPAERSAGHLESISKKADKIIDSIKNLPSQIGIAIASVLPDPGKVVRGAADVGVTVASGGLLSHVPDWVPLPGR